MLRRQQTQHLRWVDMEFLQTGIFEQGERPKGAGRRNIATPSAAQFAMPNCRLVASLAASTSVSSQSGKPVEPMRHLGERGE